VATIDQIIVRIGRRLRRGVADTTTLHTEIVDELVAAQNMLEEGATLPWFLEIEEIEVQPANTETIDTVAELADKFIRFLDDDPLLFINPAGVGFVATS